MNRTIILSITTIFLLFISSNSLISNENKDKIGIYGGLNFNMHTADFYKLKGIPNCCPDFESGTGFGFNAGLLYEYRIGNKLWIGGRIGLMTLDGELIREEETTIILENGPADGIFEHSMTGSFMNAGFEPTVIFNPFSEFFISAGARFGMNLTYDYDQIERITEPAGAGTFMDSLGNDTRSRTRNDYDGEIPDAIPFQIGLIGTFSYELPLNTKGSLKLAPELSFYYSITELVKNTDWRVNSIRAGLAIKYAPVTGPVKEEKFEREYDIDTVRIETDRVVKNTVVPGKETISIETVENDNEIIILETVNRVDTLLAAKEYELDVEISAVGVDSLGNEIPDPEFVVEEYISNRLDPILNYVFFGENSSEIPGRYIFLDKNSKDEFFIDSLYRESTIEIYHNILNVIGSRMMKNPGADLTLVGCNSGIGNEKGNLELSQKRAESVMNYLVNTWNVDPDRIDIRKRNLPEKPSTPVEEPEKITENRRVEIYSDNEEILKPVFIKKIDRAANPPVIRFKPDIASEAGIESWSIRAYQENAPERVFKAEDSGNIPENIDWKLENRQRIMPRDAVPVKYKISVIDDKGNEKRAVGKTRPIRVITLQKKRTEKIEGYEIERFSLILFDFDEALIEGNNERIIDIISDRIKPGSEINITGYTDRTGDEEHNKALSERRARTTRDALGRSDAEVRGVGEEKLLYDNSLPEGRFYSRTVVVTVKTKMK